MSCRPIYDKVMTPTRVKTKERGDIDIDRLVKHGAGRITPPAPTYADLTEIPASRGEAAAQLLELRMELLKVCHPDLLSAMLALPPDQALQAINQFRASASNANDKTNAKEQAPDDKKSNKSEEPPK